jgi:hypothetical protein
LRAQFALASANSGQKDSGESKNEVKMLGQDLYTIYSNNSYTCDVQMLGCAWIQPLMYFQLNNVPMYRGTYLVQKVSHHIAPGQMVTTFKGTRMSRLKTPMVKLYYETSKPEQTTPASERYKVLQINLKREPIIIVVIIILNLRQRILTLNQI